MERKAFPQKLLDSLKARLFILETYANKLGLKNEKTNDNQVSESHHPNDGDYTCPQCEYETTSFPKLRQHIAIHFEASSSSSKISLKRSRMPSPQVRYFGKKFHVCKECDYMTPRTGDLLVHSRRHTGEKPFSCLHCNYKAVSQSSLHVHYRTHTGEKPYTCTLCPYKTSQSSNLTTHMKKHTKTQDLICPTCSYTTTNWGKMKAHIRYNHKRLHGHLNTRDANPAPVLVKLCPPRVKANPYVCPFCDYKTFKLQLFVQHKRTHSAEVDMPYGCAYCKFRSVDIISLDLHKQTHNSIFF